MTSKTKLKNGKSIVNAPKDKTPPKKKTNNVIKTPKGKTPEKGNKTVRDFSVLKIEFLSSEHQEVKRFFQDKYKTRNSHIGKETTGRAKEKKSMKDEIKGDAQKERENAYRTKRVETLKNVKDAEMWILDEFIRRVGKGQITRKNVKELVEILREFRLAQGKPTDIRDINADPLRARLNAMKGDKGVPPNSNE